MAKGSKPVARIKMKRKDGKEGVGLNKDGSTYSAMNVELFAIWDNEGRKSGTLAKGFAVTYNGKPVPDCWFNFYEDDGATKGSNRSGDDLEDDDDIPF